MLPEIMNIDSMIINDKSELSILDDQYTVSYFSHLVETKRIKSNSIISKISDMLLASEFVDEFKKTLKTDFEYVVDLKPELKIAIEKGLVKFDKNKNGEIFAQLRNLGGKYGKKISISKRTIKNEINVIDLNNAIQLKAIEMKMEEMILVMGHINQSVSEIIHGQQNDRLGLYYSGVNLYLESKLLKDDGLRNLVISQSLKSLSDSNAQMIQSIQANVQYLVDKKYKQKKGNSSIDINERMIEINKSFETIFRSTIMKASIYYETNELPAMLMTLDEYGKFLNKVIIPIVPKLIEYDVNDIYLENGVWEKRANSLMELEGLRKQLYYNNQNQIEEGIETNA